jgi:glyoxylase-like metal-dependent hydrolase (beta-lactamase superfamily II)
MLKSSKFIMSGAILSLVITGMLWSSGKQKIQVEVFSAKESDVNAFVFFDSVGSLIVDATRNYKEGTELAELARKHGAPKILFITHGHPDHYWGMGAIKREFPKIRILVANQQIKDDIIHFAELAAQKNWLADEPRMRPKSETNPTGFDYVNEVQVLSGKTLELPAGGKLDVLSDFTRTEAEQETLLFSNELNALFASDLVYNGVHLWFGRGVDPSSMSNWKAELKKLKGKYSQNGIKIYPGHGEVSNASVFEKNINYIDDFSEVINESETKEEAKLAMMKKYPTWKNADFILVQSIKTQFENQKK